MSFATSLLAFSLNTLKGLPMRRAHAGIQSAYSTFFAAMGAKVAHSVPNALGEVDMMVDFGDFNLMVEIKSHINAFGGMYSNSNQYKNPTAALTPTYYKAIKQILAYCINLPKDKPTLCFVTSHLEFMVFDPSNFNLKKLNQNITDCPCSQDKAAYKWLKAQRPYKALKTLEVDSLANYKKDEFIAFLRSHFKNAVAA